MINKLMAIYLAQTLLTSYAVADINRKAETEQCQSLPLGGSPHSIQRTISTVSQDPVFVKYSYALLRTCSLTVPQLAEFATYCGLPELPLVLIKLPSTTLVQYSACRLLRLRMKYNNDWLLIISNYAVPPGLTFIDTPDTIPNSLVKLLYGVHSVHQSDSRIERNLHD